MNFFIPRSFKFVNFLLEKRMRLNDSAGKGDDTAPDAVQAYRKYLNGICPVSIADSS